MEDEKIEHKYSKEYAEGEDSTKYGEFIPSFDRWLPIEKQKEQAKDMVDMTKDKKDK